MSPENHYKSLFQQSFQLGHRFCSGEIQGVNSIFILLRDSALIFFITVFKKERIEKIVYIRVKISVRLITFGV